MELCGGSSRGTQRTCGCIGESQPGVDGLIQQPHRQRPEGAAGPRRVPSRSETNKIVGGPDMLPSIPPGRREPKGSRRSGAVDRAQTNGYGESSNDCAPSRSRLRHHRLMGISSISVAINEAVWSSTRSQVVVLKICRLLVMPSPIPWPGFVFRTPRFSAPGSIVRSAELTCSSPAQATRDRHKPFRFAANMLVTRLLPAGSSEAITSGSDAAQTRMELTSPEGKKPDRSARAPVALLADAAQEPGPDATAES